MPALKWNQGKSNFSANSSFESVQGQFSVDILSSVHFCIFSSEQGQFSVYYLLYKDNSRRQLCKREESSGEKIIIRC